MLNIQPIEKRRQHDGAYLEVHSIFKTIQGEGPFTGERAVFVRLAGCNLQCPGCDTNYTSTRKSMSVQNIVFAVMKRIKGPTLVVITGGEPFRQELQPLVRSLVAAGYTVQIETNGTLPPSWEADAHFISKDITQKNKCFIVCSPKTGKVNPKIAQMLCAYKYVITAGQVCPDTGLPLTALGHTAHPYLARPHEEYRGPIYVQPCDNQDTMRNERNLQACIQSVMRHGYTLQLQVHKIINME